MNTNSELERIVSTWLEARVADPPHGSLALALALVDQTPQQHRRWLPWRRGRGRSTSGDPIAPRRTVPRDRRSPMVSSAAAAAAVAALALLAVLITGPLGEVAPQPGLVPSAIRVASDGSGDFTTIGGALAAARDGDTILVAPGAYDEALLIDKDITLRGEAEAVRNVVLNVPEDAPDPLLPLTPFDPSADRFNLDKAVPVGIQLIDTDATVADLIVVGRGDGIDVLVHGGAPTLEGLTLRHQGDPLLAIDLAAGLFIEGGSSATVSDSELWYRTRIGDASAPTLTNVVFRYPQVVIQDGATPVIADSDVFGDCGCLDTKVVGGSYPTFRDSDFRASGLHIHGHDGDSTSALVEGNRFTSHETGAISVTDGATASVLGNSFTSNQQGVRVSGSSADVRDNEFVANWNGIMLTDADATVANNTIRGGVFGVSVSGSGAPLISGNLIENARNRGLFAAKGSSPTIEGNRICGSSSNLEIDPEAHPTLGHNDICPDQDVAAAG